MADYLLHGDDLLNAKTRKIKHELSEYKGVPPESYIDHVIVDEAEKTRVKKVAEQVERLGCTMFDSPSSYKFSYLYYNLIIAAAIHGDRSSHSFHDGKGTFRKLDKNLAMAALARALSLWACPHVRSSCGDSMTASVSLLENAYTKFASEGLLGSKSIGCNAQKYEILPGLQTYAIVPGLLQELAEHAANSHYVKSLLKSLSKQKAWVDEERGESQQTLWKPLPVEQRATVALSMVTYLLEDNEDEALAKDVLKPLFESVCGIGGEEQKQNKELCQTIWDLASKNEHLGYSAAGRNTESRAFFYYLLRVSNRSNNKKMDILKVLKTFEKTTHISRAKPEEMVAAQEKNECMALARGPAMHAEKELFIKKLYNSKF
jgi:hypothetical protein